MNIISILSTIIFCVFMELGENNNCISSSRRTTVFIMFILECCLIVPSHGFIVFWCVELSRNFGIGSRTNEKNQKLTLTFMALFLAFFVANTFWVSFSFDYCSDIFYLWIGASLFLGARWGIEIAIIGLFLGSRVKPDPVDIKTGVSGAKNPILYGSSK